MTFKSDALYQTLLSELPAESENFPPGPDSHWKTFAASYLADNVLSKFIEDVALDADAKAIQKFLAVNLTCKDWELECESSLDELLIGTFENKIHKFFEPGQYPLISNVGQIFDHGRNGPGAANGLPSECTTHYHKSFDSAITFTSSGLYDMYNLWTQEDPLRTDAELWRLNQHSPCMEVEGNTLFTVLKKTEISRCACKEPSGNMFGQLGIGEIVLGRLKTVFNIDLAYQAQYNRELARIGSENGTYATIDLSSASDTVSLKMLRRFLPKSILNWLELFRSDYVTLPDETRVELHMVSSMGNGFTFPLETAIFANVVSAVYDVMDVPLLRNRGDVQKHTGVPGDFAVFGDDIVVIERCRRTVIRLLELLGFTVNRDKTSTPGSFFRESCGCDYYKGHNVRPFFLKNAKTSQDFYVAINGLNSWSARTGLPLPKTIDYLMGCIRGKPLLVPMHEASDAGIIVPSFLSKPKWSRERDSHPFYHRSFVGPRLLTKDVIKTGHKLREYKRSVAKPVVRQVRSWYVTMKHDRRSKVVRLRVSNPAGVICSYLSGHIKDEKLNVRSDANFYKVARAWTPCWDAHAPTDQLPKAANDCLLEEAIVKNMPNLW